MTCEFFKKVQRDLPDETQRAHSVTYPDGDCELRRFVPLSIGMDWEQCKNTPRHGPCWRLKGNYPTQEEWQVQVRSWLSQS